MHWYISDGRTFTRDSARIRIQGIGTAGAGYGLPVAWLYTLWIGDASAVASNEP